MCLLFINDNKAPVNIFHDINDSVANRTVLKLLIVLGIKLLNISFSNDMINQLIY